MAQVEAGTGDLGPPGVGVRRAARGSGFARVSAMAFRDGMPLRPACVPDAVVVLVIASDLAVRLGREAESAEARVEALTLWRSGGPYPSSPEGSMPPGWGHPILSAQRLEVLRTWAG